MTVDQLIAYATRKIEERGIHYWSIYPHELTSNGVKTPGLYFSVCLCDEENGMYKASMWMSTKEIAADDCKALFDNRLLAVLFSLVECKEEKGLKEAESPRAYQRHSWEILDAVPTRKSELQSDDHASERESGCPCGL